MRTIIFQEINNQDLELILNLANRLGIKYQEVKEDFDIKMPDTSFLYQNLGLRKDVKISNIDGLSKKTLKRLNKADFSLAKSSFGAWGKEEETLEELLDLLNK